VEIRPKPVERHFGAFMPDTMSTFHDVFHAWGRRWYVDLAAHCDQPVSNPLLFITFACRHLITQSVQLWIPCELGAQLVKEGECGRQERHQLTDVRRVASQECICDGVHSAQLDLHLEVEPEKFAHPLVLQDHREALIQQVFQDEMVSGDCELAAPKIRMLMAHRLDQPN
jgi:hypothetical protein